VHTCLRIRVYSKLESKQVIQCKLCIQHASGRRFVRAKAIRGTSVHVIGL
jgi:hypothetical protein